MVSTRREDLNPVKEQLATDREDVDTLADALQGADVFLGVSAPGILTPEMVRTMAHDPLVLALANPTPEITYEEAMASRPDIIFATGRSDYPNQVNNVLAFPYLFRGALDVYASTINDEMTNSLIESANAVSQQSWTSIQASKKTLAERYAVIVATVGVTFFLAVFLAPTRTPAIGPSKGISEMERAQEAPIIAGISGALSGSTDTAVATICTSL